MLELHRAATLAERLGWRHGPPPAWLAELVTAYQGSDGDHRSDGRFTGLAEPLLARARQRLAVRLAALRDPAGLPFDPVDLLELLYPALPRLLDKMLLRVMVLELNAARLAEDLPGRTGEERFEAFRVRLRQPAERRRLLGVYPVLGRQLATATANWVRGAALFAERLAADWPQLAATYGTGELGTVTAVSSGLSDPHRGGLTVFAVSCGDAVRFVYKPRPLQIEARFQDLLRWLNGKGASHPFRTLSHLERSDHGWVEHVAGHPCAGPAELRRFYHRAGGLLALLYLLRANDIASENLIAHGEHPMLIDLETLCQPELALRAPIGSAAEQAAEADAEASVLRVGLLPSRFWRTAGGYSVDLSGLGGASGQLSSIAVPEIEADGTDHMRLRLARRAMEPAANQPVGADSPHQIWDYRDDVLAGFAETFELCRRYHEDGPFEAFAGAQVRVLVRDTAEYGLLRTTGSHPDVVRDGQDTERHFDRLWHRAATQPGLAAFIEHERHDLWAGDIPLFTVRTDGKVIRSSRGTPITGMVTCTGMDGVRAALGRLGPGELAKQLWLIRGSFATAMVEARGVDYPSYPFPPPDPGVTFERLVAGADAIGRHLAAITYREYGSAQWLGVTSQRGRNWSLGPLSADLFTGLSGVALFLGHLGAVSGDPGHTELARAALATALARVERHPPGHGGSSGLGGIVYALTQLGSLWEDETLLNHAVSLAPPCGEQAASDEHFDFVAGSAGSIAALRALYSIRPAPAVLQAVRACAERLTITARAAGEGVGWLAPSLVEEGVADAPLAGFAHGVAGIAWSLLEAAELCGDERYRDCALAGLDYERGLYVPDHGNWRDLRRHALEDPGFTAWCHGATGVGMGRALSWTHLSDEKTRQEITTAVRTTLRTGFGMNHSLCHGDVGNLDLLTLAADALDEPCWHDEARARMGAIVNSMDEHGWISGLPHGIEAPGLMHGLAGTGYGLLRMAAPERVPSVLTFAPPPV